jgi:hypothetical protein
VWAEVMRYGLEVKETPGATAERIIQLKDGKAIEEALAYHIGDDKSLIACFSNDHRGQDIYDEKYLQATLRKYLPDIEVTGSAGYGWVNDPFAKGTWRPN